jgi:8-oxo-dGTP diphosphatase
MATHDGNGWVSCRCGQRHWGRHGAAGLLLVTTGPPSRVLLQLRAEWTHQGGTWALPGGARDSHEDAVGAALREADEEAGADPAALQVLGELPGVDHGDWRYTYVLALARPHLAVRARNAESAELRWVPLALVVDLDLHPALRSAWPVLSAAIQEQIGGLDAGQAERC